MKKEMKKLIRWSIFEEEVVAFTSTRQIGNVSLTSDASEKTVENIKDMAKIANISQENFIGCNQTHSTNFYKVSEKDIFEGGYINGNKIENCDGLYTSIPNIALMSFHADCNPVLIYARDKKIIGAIHAGWQGTVDCIVTKMVNHLIINECCSSQEMYVYIGPSISKEALEIKDDVLELVKAMPFDSSSYYVKKNDSTYLLDAKGLNKQQLINANIPAENITISPYCTYNNDKLFYSHRRGDAERCASCILLPKK